MRKDAPKTPRKKYMRKGAPETQQRKRYKLPVRKQVLQASSIGARASTKPANTIQTCSLETGVLKKSQLKTIQVSSMKTRVPIKISEDDGNM
jgi:hypothetical protein